jgi:hypothetical protein
MTAKVDIYYSKKFDSAQFLYCYHTDKNSEEKGDCKKLVAISSLFCSVTNPDVLVM